MDVLEGGWRSCVREVSFLVLEWNWNKKGMFSFFLRTLDDCEVWVWCERGWIAGEDGDGVIVGEGLGENEAAVAAGGSGDEDVHFYLIKGVGLK